MMIGLALTLVAFAASAAATGYLDGQEYVYRYTGVMHTGYPHIKPQEAGYIYNMKLTIQPEGDHAIFKLDNAHKANFNGEFEDVTEHKHDFVDLPPNAEYLTKPFRVTRKNGIVTHFETSRDEPSFYVNLKRGIVSFFNLNFEGSSAGGSTENNDITRPDPHAHYYKLYEESLLGECETSYVIEHHPYNHQENHILNVTKVRNFHKCHTRPNQVYNVFHGHDCAHAEHDQSHTLHGNAQYHYSIRGDRQGYVIEKVKSVSEVAYTPYPLEGESVVTTIQRSLELIEEHPVTTPVVLAGDLEDHEHLIYEFDFQKDFKDHSIDLKKPNYIYHLTGRKVPLSDIHKQFEELTHVYDDETYHAKIKDKNFPAKFVELLRSVATLGYDEIEELYNTYGKKPDGEMTQECKLRKSLFLDTLVSLGTNPAFAFGKHMIEESLLSESETRYFIQHLQFHIKEVSEVLLDQLQELCENDHVKENNHVECAIALSNIVYEHCIAHYHPEGLQDTGAKNVCPYESAVKYFNYIAKLYENAKNDKEKMGYMKAAGNIGVKEVLPYVTPYVEGQGHHDIIERENALWSLRNVGHKYPEKVRNLLVPLLFNRTEHYELRIASFVLLLKFNPELYEIEGVARALLDEPDDQVKSFIYSTFKHLENSTSFCDEKISQDASYAMRILDAHHELFEDYDYSFSQNHYVAGYDDDYDFGGSSRFAYVASDTGYVPRSVYMGFTDIIGGKSFQTIGFGMRQFGLEKFFDKIFGPEGSFGKRSVFDLFKKRDKRDAASTKKELNEIKSHVKLPVVDYDHIHGEVFFKYMGNYISSYHFDDESFGSFFKEGRFQIDNIPAAFQNIPEYHYQRFMLSVDKYYVVPSDSGIPMFFDYKQPVYIYHHNKESHFKVEPDFFAEGRDGKYPDHVKLETDGHFVVDKNLIAYVGVPIPADQVIFGAGINKRCTLSLPLKVKLDLVVAEKKLKTHWTPVAPHEIYHFKYEPYTFIDSYANTVPLTEEEGYHAVKRVHNHEIHKHFFHDALGVGFDINADYENEFNDFGSWMDFFLEKDFRQKFYYLYANPHFEPYHVDVEFTHADHDATKEVDFEFTYKSFDDDWVIPHFPEEHFEDYDKHKEGTDHFHTCVLKADLMAHGDKERKIHSVVSWTRDLYRTFHKVNFFYERTPFASEEHDDMKICLSSYLKYPEYDLKKFATLDTLDLDHKVHSGLKVHFGKNCDSDQKFKIEGLFDETEEQHEFEKHRAEPTTPEHYNEYSQYYHECLEERKHGQNFGDNCEEYFNHVTMLHKYNFDIKFEHLSKEFLNKTYLLGRYLKYSMALHSDHNEIDVNNPDNEIHIEANFSSKLPVADIRVQKPHSNSNYYNVYFPHYTGFNSFPHFENIHVVNSLSNIYCSIEGDHVSTFDEYNYELPPIDCYKVIARDCSPNEHFTVLATKIKHNKYHKAVKVFIEDHKVEFLPITEDSEIIVRVDGKRVPVAVHEPYIHEGKDHHNDFYLTFRDIYYALHSEKYGLIVEYTGDAVFVVVSPFYRNKMCGICGNYNGQKHDNPLTAEGCHYHDTNDFAYSFTVESDTCHVPEHKHDCDTEGGCTRLYTKVLQLTSGKIPQTCFSREAASECSAHCKSSGTVSRKFTFHCLPAKDDSTKALLKEQEHRVLYEISRKSVDHETTVDVPIRCRKE